MNHQHVKSVNNKIIKMYNQCSIKLNKDDKDSEIKYTLDGSIPTMYFG